MNLSFFSYSCGLCIAFVSCIFIAVSAVEKEPLKPEEIYKGCGTRTKKCFGDKEGCLINQSCTFVAAIEETETTLKAEIQNNCNANDTSNLFFAVGSEAAKSGPGAPLLVVCLPSLDDFKVIMLWSGERCPKRGSIEKKWSVIPNNKTALHTCQTAKEIGNLADFATQNILVQTGKGHIPTLTRRSTLKDNGAVYITPEPSKDQINQTPSAAPNEMNKEKNLGSGISILTAVNILVFSLISNYVIG